MTNQPSIYLAFTVEKIESCPDNSMQYSLKAMAVSMPEFYQEHNVSGTICVTSEIPLGLYLGDIVSGSLDTIEEVELDHFEIEQIKETTLAQLDEPVTHDYLHEENAWHGVYA